MEPTTKPILVTREIGVRFRVQSLDVMPQRKA